MTDLKYLAGGEEWLYPAAGDEPAPLNTKIFILTVGNTATVGVWRPEMGDKGWRHLFKRNKEKEKQIERIHNTRQV